MKTPLKLCNCVLHYISVSLYQLGSVTEQEITAMMQEDFGILSLTGFLQRHLVIYCSGQPNLDQKTSCSCTYQIRYINIFSSQLTQDFSDFLKLFIKFL